MNRVGRILCAGIVVIMFGMGAALAQGDDETLRVPWMEDGDVVVVDGETNESVWREAEHGRLALDADDDEGPTRFVDLYTVHNGTSLFFLVHAEADTEAIVLQFDPAAGNDGSGRSLDALRVGADGTVTDLDYDVEEGRWVEDASDCSAHGAAAVVTRGSGMIFEIEKPLEGDVCDMFVTSDQPIGLRMAVEANGETHRWPEGTSGGDGDFDRDGGLDEELGDWGSLVLDARFEDVGQEVPNDQGRPAGEPGLETDPNQRPFDTDRPIQPNPVDDDGAYNADSEATPGVGWVMLALVALAGLALVARARR